MKINNTAEGNDETLFKGRSTRLSQAILSLKPGQELHIEKGKDWIGKKPPYYVINRVKKKTGWQLVSGRPLEGGKWIVRRIK